MTLSILISVTHLLGAGHLTRAAALARAFSARGHRVMLISGGRKTALALPDEVEFVQLPCVGIEGTDFRTLLDEKGSPVSRTFLETRIDKQIQALHAFRPKVVITELFPFGRKVLSEEYEALLATAVALHPRPLVVSSVRDILAPPSNAQKAAQTEACLERFYDLVLIHGDPDLVPLEASWPLAETMRSLLVYTGYIDEQPATETPTNRDGIIVSGGSSSASLPLYETAIAAAKLRPDLSWRILIGKGVSEPDFEALCKRAPANAHVERARPDFRNLLQQAAVSISQAGYNTVVDLLRTGPAAILVPFEGGRETEQRLRAQLLQERGLAICLAEADLSPERLLESVAEALSRDVESTSLSIDLGGLSKSVSIIEQATAAPAALRSPIDWQPLREAVKQVRDEGREIGFWWRDDDAFEVSPALTRLLSLARDYAAPLALAVVPDRVQSELAAILAEQPRIDALVHGYQHRNHAPPSEKKAEFGDHRPLETLAADAKEGLALARQALGATLLPVFVPPWNRISPRLVPHLASLGYQGLSTFNHQADSLHGLRLCDTHLDPVDWRTRSLTAPEHLIQRLAQTIRRHAKSIGQTMEPIGLLTHHLMQDEAIWFFCEAFLQEAARNEIRFFLARDLFCGDNQPMTVKTLPF